MTFFSLHFGDTVHHGWEVKAEGLEAAGHISARHQEAEGDGCWGSVHFLYFGQSETP